MQRNQPENKRDPRASGERGASQPIGGQPRTDDEDDALQKPDDVPSLLTARELQAREPGKGEARDSPSGERHASASFTGSKGEPRISDEEPPRGARGLPETRSDEMLKKNKAP